MAAQRLINNRATTMPAARAASPAISPPPVEVPPRPLAPLLPPSPTPPPAAPPPAAPYEDESLISAPQAVVGLGLVFMGVGLFLSARRPPPANAAKNPTRPVWGGWARLFSRVQTSDESAPADHLSMDVAPEARPAVPLRAVTNASELGSGSKERWGPMSWPPEKDAESDIVDDVAPKPFTQPVD
jgi:hypothetical protein|eukprot:7187719-Prymnesium_polylepis.2